MTFGSERKGAARSGARLLAGALAVALVGFVHVTPARADTVLSIDGDYVAPIREEEMDAGYGVTLRGGPRLDLKILTLTSELVGEYRDLGGASEPRIYRGLVGARLGIGAILRPKAFVHMGLGHARFGKIYDSRTGFSGDVGLGLDVTVLPVINVGAHGAYGFMTGSQPLSWLNLGGHVQFVF